jgi:CBS domain-containing protein
MKIREIMVKSPKYCDPGSNCAAAIERLWSTGCGALPVVDAGKKVVGIITDRDICIALGTRNRRPAELLVGEVMTSDVATCRADDDIHDALHTMRLRKVRRLPVVDAAGRLEGILCATDVLLYARHEDGSRPELSYENVVATLRAIYWHDGPHEDASRSQAAR